MFNKGEPHWEALVETMDCCRMHEEGYDGKETFVAAWDKVQKMVKWWHTMDELNSKPGGIEISEVSLGFRREYYLSARNPSYIISGLTESTFVNEFDPDQVRGLIDELKGKDYSS